MVRRLVWLPSVLALLGCGGAGRDEQPPPRDPQVARALEDRLMTDPDLSSQNEGAAALTVEVDVTLPVLLATPEAVAAARAEAAALVGGADQMTSLPRGARSIPPLVSRDPAAHLAVLPTDERCGSDLGHSAIWAARMPRPIPAYPRAAVQSAAGSDRPGCRVRVAQFTTPVPASEVLAFYAASARKSGLSAVHYADGAGDALRGAGNGIAFDLRIAAGSHETEVRLAVALR